MLSNPHVASIFPRTFMVLFAMAWQVTDAQESAQPSISERYQLSKSLGERTENRVFRDRVEAHWFGKQQNKFWYRVTTAQNVHSFVLVDAAAGATQPAFDHIALAEQLSELGKVPAVADRLDLKKLRFDDELSELGFDWRGRSWLFSLPSGPLAENIDRVIEPPSSSNKSHDKSRSRSSDSPDGRYRVSFRDQNAVLHSNEEDTESILTSDATSDDFYGSQVWWSPDSKRFVAMRTHAGDRRQISMVRSSPDGSVHAVLETLPYEKPGDRRDHALPYLFEKDNDWKPTAINDSLFLNPFDLNRLAWKNDSQSFSFLYNERGHQRLSLIHVDVETKSPTVTIDETSETFVCYSSKTYLRRLDESDELIWMSERSGYNHLYLIDQQSGEVKNAITSGDWVVREVEHIDEQKRQIWLSVSGIDGDQDPYFKHLVRVDFSGESLQRLTEGDGDHQWEFSPDRRYLIDRMSRVDLPPVTTLRNGDTGATISELERADVSSLLETGWQPPERFVAKGRDGKTDIFGMIVRPTNFDPKKAYPVVENIYAGPHSSFVPKSFGVHRDLHEMAELGFIVVKVDGMGTSNRSKAFHDVCWRNLHDSGFPDRIEWIKAAAKERPWMDLSRVGIYGGSAGGQSAMRALIDHGDFYHVAVADCGCHDNRVDKIWWNEQWMGWPVEQHYEDASNVAQAHRLNGDLLLIWGEVDKNVDPTSTMQVVNALVKADKDFEMLCIPGSGHGAAGGPYAKRKQAEFLMRKLNENANDNAAL